MGIITFDKDTIVDYMPLYGSNRESENPCIVKMKLIPHSRIVELQTISALRMKNKTTTEESIQEKCFIQEKQFVESVQSISGYYVGDREVTDPKEFYDTVDKLLMAEVVSAMESSTRLSGGQVKNS